MEYCQLPEIGNMCNMDHCQACDLFPVDMGIDVAPLQEKINACKRRYHREVWQILCDGVDKQSPTGGNARNKQAGRGGENGYEYGDDDDDDDDDDEQETLGYVNQDGGKNRGRTTHPPGGGSKSRNQNRHQQGNWGGGKRGGGAGRKRPSDDTPDSGTTRLRSSNARVDQAARRSRRSHRHRDGQRSVSIGGVSGWTPIAAQLDELRSTLASSYRRGGGSGRKTEATATHATTGTSRTSTKPTPMSATTKPTTTTSVTRATVTGTGTGTSGLSKRKNRLAHTLVFTLSTDPSKRLLISDGGNSFRTTTATATETRNFDDDTSFVPLLCGEWGGGCGGRGGGGGSRGGATSRRQRRPRSQTASATKSAVSGKT